MMFHSRVIAACLLSLLLVVSTSAVAEPPARVVFSASDAATLNQLGITTEKAAQAMNEMGMNETDARTLLDAMQQSPAQAAQRMLDLNMPPAKATSLLQKMGLSEQRINALLETMGEAITREQKQRNAGWGDTQARMMMTIRNADGTERVRDIRVKTLEVPGDGDKSLSVFESPKDVRNTALLTETHINGPDSQWLYLPKLKRVKRISMINKSAPFMGSEFSYEDMASFEVEKYRIRYLDDNVRNGVPCFVVEMIPKDEHSGYSRLIAYVEKERYLAHQIDYYNLDNVHFKTMQLDQFKQHQNKFWRAHRLIMTNQLSGDATTILWQEYQFNTGLTQDDFTQQALKRAG